METFKHFREEENFSKCITKEQIERDDFNVYRSIQKVKLDQRISIIESDFKKYKLYKLSDIAMEIVKLHHNVQLIHPENCIFIPIRGNSKIVSNREDTKLKDQSLIRVSLKEKVILPEYLTILLNSELGKEILKSIKVPGFMPFIRLSEIKNLSVNVPDISEQDKIIKNVHKMALIKQKVKNIEDELQSKPLSDEQGRIIDNILNAVKNLNSEMSPLLSEESIVHEFKKPL